VSSAVVVGSIFAFPTSARAQSASPGAPGGDGRGAGAFLAEYYADVIINMTDAMATWRLSWRQGDLDGTIDSYWDNAQIFFPGRSPIIDKAAVERFYAGLLPSVGEMQTSMIDFDASGRMAFVSGPFYYEVPGAGDADRVEGSHVTVLVRRGRDWRIRTQIFVADEPVADVATPLPQAVSTSTYRDRASGSSFLADYYADVVTNTGFTIDDWHVAWRNDDVEGAVNAYWEEAQILFPGRLPIIGRSAMQEFYAELLPEVGRVHTGMLDFDASGRMAFLSGPFFYEVLRASGTPERVEGTHMTIFVRKGRNWRIRSQIFRAKETLDVHPE